ncbi:pyrokinin-1 receptor-like isoform X1 [Varroa jacobsoni]|uniref:pyrokinin-1 receptor-like isoform X1 n=2 Tax=Varroa jacobsoni TaxID=62625 RepID=UPI000BF2B8FB|nr:pyrokinin-1 receptor-like isoform X1 [Varroa jacobsoni]
MKTYNETTRVHSVSQLIRHSRCLQMCRTAMAQMDNGDIIMTGVNTSGVDPSWQLRPNFTFSDPCNSQQVDQYLAMTLGPRQVAWSKLLPMTVIYSLIFVSGLVGNLSTCIVIVQNPHMHTATNYYLFNLAVSDLLTLVFGLPNDLVTYWRQYPYAFGSTFCSVRNLVAEMTSNTSVLTIVAFTLERYLAICHPLYKHKMSNQLPRVLKILTIVWLIAFVSALPFAARSGLRYEFVNDIQLDDSAFCIVQGSDSVNIALFVGSTVTFFILPMIFIIILYMRIGFKLRRSTSYKSAYQASLKESLSSGETMKPGTTTSEPVRKFSLINGTRQQQHHLSSSRKIIKLLVCVVIIFFICYAPYHGQRLMYAYGTHIGWTHRLRALNEELFYIAGCLYFVNCTINPILYNVISKKYRAAFKHTLCRCCGLRATSTYSQGDHRLSYSSLGMSNQQRALERKRYSEGNLVSVGSMKFDLALPVPLTHSGSVMVGDPMARVHAVDAGPLVSRASLIQKTNHIATCLPNDSSMVPHVPIHHTTTCNPCTTTRTSPVALRSLLRRNRSVSMRSTVTFLDTPSIKGCIRDPSIWCIEEVGCDGRSQEVG